MSFIIGLLTVLLVLDCLVLTLLVLVQLPKKDAGAGLAFGGGAADALFVAGSGNVLTKSTKYAAAIFFGLTIMIGMMNARVHKSKNQLALPENWQGSGAGVLAPPAGTPPPAGNPATVPPASATPATSPGTAPPPSEPPPANPTTPSPEAPKP